MPPPTTVPAPPVNRRKWPLLVAAGLALAAVAVVAVVVLTGGEESSPYDTDAAAAVIDDLFQRADEAVSFELDECPVDLEVLVRGAPESASLGEYVRPADFAAVLRPEDSNISLVECSSANDGGIVGVSLGRSPGRDSFQADMASYVPYHDLAFDEFRAYAGGTLVTYCGTVTADAPEGFNEFCEADWFDDQVVIGVFAGPGEATKAELEAWLKSSLSSLVDEFADA
jgi:hypothetical protein